jgi:hypothetical protein
MRVRRLPVVDEYVEGGEAVVFVDGNVVALSELATAALTSVGWEWTDLQEVTAALVAQFGEPAEGVAVDQVVTAALEQLARLSIVEMVEHPAS